ncbi:hypothetical protein NF27_DP00480 [Candidatus Jidaibacter acanthamoeba]|uniref:Protein-export membrane protein SecG n=2 Tax=Candidatus Jidaibacter acanthamoebae TaxID=86105 RepID=A0A0C1QJ25_9RICK|nr:hypothetical protein NF27_DP00480 [Candidatus Jidaibacter acanthamoeba]
MGYMATVLLILQIFIVLALVAVILIQKTGNDGLSGLSGGGHNVLSGRATGNIFSKLTMFLAAAFMINSLALAKLVILERKEAKSIIESIGDEHLVIDRKHSLKAKEAPQAPIAK